MKKSFKALLSVVMAVVLLAGTFTGIAFIGVDLTVKSSAVNRDIQKEDPNGKWILYTDGDLIVESNVSAGYDMSSPWYTNSTNIRTVTLKEGVTYIDDYTFQECSNLKSIFIPSTVTYVGKYAFTECPSLNKIYYPGSNDKWKTIVDTEIYDAKVVFNHTKHENLITKYAETANCGKAGNSGYKYCAECGYCVSEGEVIPPTNDHSWSSSLKVRKEATCGVAGEKAYQCTVCGIWREEGKQIIKATGNHIYNKYQPVSGKCSDSGGCSYKEVCSVCGKVNDNIKVSKEHSYIYTNHPATCTEQGYTHLECKYCGVTEDKDFKDPLGHDSGHYKVITAATCTEDGIQVLVCNRCGVEIGEREAIEKKGHDLKNGTWTTVKEPTCTENGRKVYSCPNCKELVKNTDADKVAPVLDTATLSRDPRYSEYLSTDNEAVRASIENRYWYVPLASFHTARDSKGKLLYCEYKSEGTFVINDYVDDITAVKPTCCTTGTEVLVCSKCNKAVSTGEKWAAKAVTRPVAVDPENHSIDYSSVANGSYATATDVIKVEPTYTAEGKETVKCSGCGKIISEKTLPKKTECKEHQWIINSTNWVEDTSTQIQYVCAVCGKKEMRYPSEKHLEHEYSEIIIDKEPTCTANGQVHKRCKYCIAVEEASAEKYAKATGHNYELKYEDKATCTKYGKTVKVCANCGLAEVKSVERLSDHFDLKKDKKEEKVEPTCVNPGMIKVICTKCGKIVTEKVDPDAGEALGHEIGKVDKVNATCENDGIKEHYSCSRCNKKFFDKEATNEVLYDIELIIPKKDHVIAYDEGYPATCTTEGLTGGQHCAVCGKILIPQETIPAVEGGHTIVVIPGEKATCVKDGKTEGQYCSTCGL
ncbi:MAG: leucine-rich repeat domain-containing protein, partial [Clostridia bacterium]|nr:leucine-rich repeat domain-containing protein [Clostridia bacterium]